MKNKLLLFLMLVSYSLSISAQSTRSGTIVVREMNSFLSTTNNGSLARTSSGAETLNTSQVRDLITKVQSSIYFYNGEVKTYGDQPTNLFTDVTSLSQVDNSVALKQNIEIVTVRINTLNELNATIDLNAFSNFPNLKYIYFISNIETTSGTIASRLVNYNSRFNVFYKIDKGDSNQY